MALSWPWWTTLLMNEMAASCSNLKRSRMLLLVSIRMPRRRGRSVSAVNSAMVLRLLVFEHLEVVLRQVGDEAALLVGDREEHVDAGDVQNNAGTGIVDDLGRLLRGRRNRLLRPDSGAAHGHGRREKEGFHLD
jgi:hypothetical protein